MPRRQVSTKENKFYTQICITVSFELRAPGHCQAAAAGEGYSNYCTALRSDAKVVCDESCVQVKYVSRPGLAAGYKCMNGKLIINRNGRSLHLQ